MMNWNQLKMIGLLSLVLTVSSAVADIQKMEHFKIAVEKMSPATKVATIGENFITLAIGCGLSEATVTQNGGAVVELVVDLFQTISDLADGRLDDREEAEEYQQAFHHIQTIYLSTLKTAKIKLSKGSHCIDSFNRLNILFNIDVKPRDIFGEQEHHRYKLTPAYYFEKKGKNIPYP